MNTKRVLKRKTCDLATIFILEYKQPSTISDFIEKHEHEALKPGEHADKKALSRVAEKFFQEG